MTTAITTTTATDLRTDRAAFEPTTLPEALHVSQVLVASRLLPRSIQTPEAAFAVIATGRELGLSAMQALRAIHIVEGKPTLSADLMVALVKRSPECGFFRLVESSAERATYETQRRGEPSPTRLSFTIEEARAAGAATKDNWRKYPAAMLRARAASALARAVYPDLVLGVCDPDELDVRDVTPPSPATIAAPVVLPPEPTPVEPPPARRRRAAAPPPDVTDVEPVEQPAPTVDVPQLVRDAANLDAVRAVLDAHRETLASDPVLLVVSWREAFARCSTAVECNDVARGLKIWRDQKILADAQVETLRAIYSSRKSECAAGAN